MKAFQSLFPPLAPGSLALSSARRIVLVAYNPEHGTVDVRHYAIAVRPAGVSKRVRRVVEGPSARARTASGVLDLSLERDVADYVLRQAGADGYESAASDASSAAGDDPAAAVALTQDYVGRGNRAGTRRAVRLDEIGPRLELRLLKIAEGLPGKEGQVIFHEFGKRARSCMGDAPALTTFQSKRARRRTRHKNASMRRRSASASNAERNRRGIYSARRRNRASNRARAQTRTRTKQRTPASKVAIKRMKAQMKATTYGTTMRTSARWMRRVETTMTRSSTRRLSRPSAGDGKVRFGTYPDAIHGRNSR
jgi:hypothetical protein